MRTKWELLVRLIMLAGVFATPLLAQGDRGEITGTVTDATGADGIKLVQYNEAPAGQSVFHLHFHLIPVYDGVEVGRHGQGKADDAELSALAVSIASELR